MTSAPIPKQSQFDHGFQAGLATAARLAQTAADRASQAGVGGKWLASSEALAAFADQLRQAAQPQLTNTGELSKSETPHKHHIGNPKWHTYRHDARNCASMIRMRCARCKGYFDARDGDCSCPKARGVSAKKPNALAYQGTELLSDAKAHDPAPPADTPKGKREARKAKHPAKKSARAGRPLKGTEAHTITAQTPWKAAGVSRRTWYRRQGR